MTRIQSLDCTLARRETICPYLQPIPSHFDPISTFGLTTAELCFRPGGNLRLGHYEPLTIV
jgi:hypothetical protein